MTTPRKTPGPKPRAGVTAATRLELRLTREERARWIAAAQTQVETLAEYVRRAVEERISRGPE